MTNEAFIRNWTARRYGERLDAASLENVTSKLQEAFDRDPEYYGNITLTALADSIELDAFARHLENL